MIKANELRIGNLIIDDDGCAAKVNGFTPFDHSVRCDEVEGCALLIDVYHEVTGKWKLGREADSPECNPIPLTPEWLERCGFESINSNLPILMRSPSFDGFRQFRWDSDGFKIETVRSGWIWPLEHIKHVHQLQNLFFALTGEELNVKL